MRLPLVCMIHKLKKGVRFWRALNQRYASQVAAAPAQPGHILQERVVGNAMEEVDAKADDGQQGASRSGCAARGHKRNGILRDSAQPWLVSKNQAVSAAVHKNNEVGRVTI